MNQPIVKAEAPRTFVRPLVDVFENDAEYLIVADVPGATKESIEVHYHDGELALEARRGPVTTGKSLGEERRRADYRRVFAMPDGIDAEKIEAKIDAGVLRLRLPKSQAQRTRRIEVRSA